MRYYLQLPTVRQHSELTATAQALVNQYLAAEFLLQPHQTPKKNLTINLPIRGQRGCAASL